MPKLIDEEIINKFKQYNKNVRVRVLIDWFNRLETEDVDLEIEDLGDYMVVFEDEIENLSITRSLEGVEGTSIRDDATVTLSNVDGNMSPKTLESNLVLNGDSYVEPVKYTIIQLKIEGEDEWINYYSGLLTNIQDTRLRGDVSLEIDDILYTLQEKMCPNRLYLDDETEETEKARPLNSAEVAINLLQRVNFISYDEDSIRENLTSKIIYNFKDMNVFEALNMICQKNNSFFFMRDDDLVVKSKMFLAEQGAETVEVFSDKETELIIDGETVETKENMFEVEETLNRDNLFNEIEITSEPLETQLREEIVWTGGEEVVDVAETYQGNDLTEDQEIVISGNEESEFDQIFYSWEDGIETEVTTNTIQLKEDTRDIAVFVDVLIEGSPSSSTYNFGIKLFTNQGEKEEIYFEQLEGRNRVRNRLRNVIIEEDET